MKKPDPEKVGLFRVSARPTCMKPLATFGVAMLLTGSVAPAQSPRSHFESFEVATIKPTSPDWTAGRFIRMQTASQLIARNYTLKILLAAAWNVSPRAIAGGPAWLDTEHFDVLAKTPGSVRPNLDEQIAMLRRLILDRFQLTFHREPKEMPVFALTVSPSGPKHGLKPKEITVQEDQPEGPPPLIFVLAPQIIRLPARSASMPELAAVFQRAALDRPVVDRTGLTGRYDFELEWAPDETQFGGALGKAVDDNPRPGLFTAIQQQLGLRLEPTTASIDLFVVDKAEHPTEN